jgi:hypothetical protein
MVAMPDGKEHFADVCNAATASKFLISLLGGIAPPSGEAAFATAWLAHFASKRDLASCGKLQLGICTPGLEMVGRSATSACRPEVQRFSDNDLHQNKGF